MKRHINQSIPPALTGGRHKRQPSTKPWEAMSMQLTLMVAIRSSTRKQGSRPWPSGAQGIEA